MRRLECNCPAAALAVLLTASILIHPVRAQPAGYLGVLFSHETVYVSAEVAGSIRALHVELGAEVEQGTGYVKGLHPGHATVCLTYLAPPRLDPGTPAKITIEAASTTPPGTIDPEDYFSVSVVELEHSADIAGLYPREAS